MGQANRPLTVLVVEDSEIMGTLLAKLLAQEPDMQHVGTVTTAQTAIAAIAAAHPDVTLLDLFLGAGNGFEVLRALKDIPGPRPNVIVLTNLAGEPYEARAKGTRRGLFFRQKQGNSGSV
jgi:two-component system chemotaxis response regulator CheB